MRVPYEDLPSIHAPRCRLRRPARQFHHDRPGNEFGDGEGHRRSAVSGLSVHKRACAGSLAVTRSCRGPEPVPYRLWLKGAVGGRRR